ncbi:MAG: hypothetical protein N2654_07810 [Deltaproteobacteria bacterium]|nr:hypothetical protein [Deltaproteobacteria bacterium]
MVPLFANYREAFERGLKRLAPEESETDRNFTDSFSADRGFDSHIIIGEAETCYKVLLTLKEIFGQSPESRIIRTVNYLLRLREEVSHGFNDFHGSDHELEWVIFAKSKLRALVEAMAESAWYLYPERIRNGSEAEISTLSLTESQKELKYNIDKFLGTVTYLLEWLRNQTPSDMNRKIALDALEKLKIELPDFIRSLDITSLKMLASRAEVESRIFEVGCVTEQGAYIQLRCNIRLPDKTRILRMTN